MRGRNPAKSPPPANITPPDSILIKKRGILSAIGKRHPDAKRDGMNGREEPPKVSRTPHPAPAGTANRSAPAVPPVRHKAKGRITHA